MLKEKKIGETEAVALLVTSIASKVYLTTPAVYIDLCQNAAWIMILISGLVTLAFFWFVAKYMELFPEQTFPVAAEDVLGPFMGSLLVLLMSLILFSETGLSIRKYSEMILLVALPEIDIALVIAIFLVSCAMACYFGANTIAGAAYISYPFSLSAVSLICILSFSLWNTAWLFPIFSKGIDHTLLMGVLRSSDYIELIFLYLFVDLFYPKQIKRIGYKTIGLSTLILLLVILVYSLSFPAPIGLENYLPLYTLARNIYLGRFLQRIEAIFVLFWVISGCIWLSMSFYMCCRLLSEFLKLPDYRPLIPAVAVLLYSIAILPSSFPETSLYSDHYLRNYSFILAYGIPALLLVIAIIRKKAGKVNAKK